jgi:hypothetical protein
MPALVVITMPHKTGEPNDQVTQSWSVVGINSATDAADLAAATVAFTTFFNTDVPAAGAMCVADIIAPCIDRVANGCKIKYYDLTGHLDGSPHGSPFRTDSFTLGASSAGNGYPEEIAIAVTLEAFGRTDAPVEVPDGADPDGLVDRLKQRHTGRIYIGPTCVNAATLDSNLSPRPSSTVRTLLTGAVDRLDNDLHGLPTQIAAVGIWSRADEIMRSIEAVSVDDSFDSQRRRGVGPTTRTRLVV